MMLEQIIQITAIITFLASAIVFFIKIGEYKSLINNKIDVLENDVNECQNDIKELQHKIESLEANNSQFMPALSPGKSHGQRSLAGYSPWGHKELDTTE